VRALASKRSKESVSPAACQTELQKLMWEKAGHFRTQAKLVAALDGIKSMQKELVHLSIGPKKDFDLDLQDWFELRAMLITAEAVVVSALARNESRGAHQREDFPAQNPNFRSNQLLELKGNELVSKWDSPVGLESREATR
jgi:succinate dehydrogenase/fumarate reductase flavoprotein subunit